MESGIVELDRILSVSSGANASPIPPDAREAVSAVQSLLIGHGYEGLPTLLAPSCGVFGPRTIGALRHFQTSQRLEMTGTMDAPTIRQLVAEPASSAIVSRAYVACVLDVTFTPLLRVAAVTMEVEGGGRFGACNWNTDRCGLSFGLIQWAQRPGRLHELLAAFQRAEPDRFVQILGAGDRRLAQDLLAHAALPNGGVDPATGRSVNPAFDLVLPPWRDRFLAAGRDVALQRVQIETALTAFSASAAKLAATVPIVTTERGIVFMLDVANQFGDAGAARLAAAVLRPDMTEVEFLQAVADRSVAAVSRQYGETSAAAKSTANRRSLVRTTTWLRDEPAVLA